MKSEEELFLKRINQKQLEAFHELFRNFYRSLVGYALKYINRQEIAEDIVQEVFMQIWEQKEAFRSYNGFRSFLYLTVRNSCLNYIKHKKVEERYINYTQTFQNTDDEILKIMEEEVFRQLFNIIDELPARCREVFNLHLAGKKNEEIAKQLNISILTVKTQKRDAMQYIKKRMGNLFYLLIILNII